MRKGKDLIGLSVIGQDDGTNLGRVRDLIFDRDTDQVLALVVDERDLFGLIEAHIVPWRAVQSVGSDVILVQNSAAKVRLKDDEAIRAVAETHRESVLSGTQILTGDGKVLGTLADMVIDEQTGRVAGYEVSGGLVADTLRGKQLLPGSTAMSIGKDVAMVAPDAADTMTKS